ncbi:hypothetical protein HDU86_006076 [Geranomyces michiganensis]|nr:hypothetical protein HDU86_006076 [Geranomyces michiganensis]
MAPSHSVNRLSVTPMRFLRLRDRTNIKQANPLTTPVEARMPGTYHVVLFNVVLVLVAVSFTSSTVIGGVITAELEERGIAEPVVVGVICEDEDADVEIRNDEDCDNAVGIVFDDVAPTVVIDAETEVLELCDDAHTEQAVLEESDVRVLACNDADDVELDVAPADDEAEVLTVSDVELVTLGDAEEDVDSNKDGVAVITTLNESDDENVELLIEYDGVEEEVDSDKDGGAVVTALEKSDDEDTEVLVESDGVEEGVDSEKDGGAVVTALEKSDDEDTEVLVESNGVEEEVDSDKDGGAVVTALEKSDDEDTELLEESDEVEEELESEDGDAVVTILEESVDEATELVVSDGEGDGGVGVAVVLDVSDEAINVMMVSMELVVVEMDVDVMVDS